MRKIIIVIFIFIFQLAFCQEIKYKLMINSKEVELYSQNELDLIFTFSGNKTVYLNSEERISKKINFKREFTNLNKIELKYQNVKYLIAVRNDTNKKITNLIDDDIDKIIKLGKLDINIDKFPYSDSKSKDLLKNESYANSIRNNEFEIIYINDSWMYVIPKYDAKKEVLLFSEKVKIELCECVKDKLKDKSLNDLNLRESYAQCFNSKIEKLIEEMYKSYSTYFNEEELNENEKNDVFNSEVKLFMETLNEYLIKTCLKK